MGELDLIRSFRTDVPAPSAAARARAERAWRSRPSRAPRHVRRLALGLAVLAALVVTAVLISGGDDDRLGVTDARAAQTLRHAASNAHENGLPVPGPGDYAYLRSRETNGGQELVRESWMGADGTLRTRTRFGPPRGDVETHRFGGDGRFVQFGDRALTYEELLNLPTDAGRLYGVIRAEARKGGGSSARDESFAIVSDVLRHVPLPADLRAAFYRAAAMIPGIEYIPGVRDAAGRPGVGVAYDDNGRRRLLIFDPDDGRLLGSSEIVLATGAPMSSAAYVDEGIVRSDSSRP
jgi:hypothetical protein